MAIILDPSIGITNVDGTAAAPANTGTDTNTGIFYGTDIVGISTGGSERVRVGSSGNVGIGVTSTSSRLEVLGSVVNTISAAGTEDAATLAITNSDVSGIGRIAKTLYEIGNLPIASVAGIYTNFNATNDIGGALAFSTQTNAAGGVVERMRIDSSGNVLIGTTSNFSADKQCLNFTSSQNGLGIRDDSNSSGAYYTVYRNSTNGIIGSVTRVTTTNAVAYNTSSDYRLKENILPMTDALDKVAQLKPVTYIWKDCGLQGQGFIAHELAEVIPDAVSGEKDAVDDEGNPKYQGVDTSFLVATLTAAIQEQQTIINDLKARIETLEGK